MNDESGVIHDAASLHRFVGAISAFCEIDSGFPAYLEASQEFLSTIRALARATRSYLEQFPTKLPDDPSEYPVYRQELLTLRNGWYEIHRRVKPIADADTLHLPSALINNLTRRLRTVESLRNVRLAVLHIERLNYLQVGSSRIREIAAQVSSIVGGDPFPPTLGLIGIPYSQADSAFLNCLIPHEMGHFVYAELQISRTLFLRIRSIFNAAFSPMARSLDKRHWRTIANIFTGWVEELFCDLFAIQFIGPCYSFAFIEIFDLPNVLDKEGKLNSASAAPFLEFSDSHPAFLYRLAKQRDLLQGLGWWDEIKESKSRVVQVLKAAALNISDFSFTFPETTSSIQTAILKAIDESISEIVLSVGTALAGLDSGVTEYATLKQLVREYLLEGVVPSTIAVSGGKSRSPSSVTILNVAYQVYLESMHELLFKIRGQNSSSVEQRMLWTRRLESWTLKALDDLELLSQQPD